MGAAFQRQGNAAIFPVMARPGFSQEPPIPTTWDSFTPGHDAFGMPKPAYGDEKMPVIDPGDLRSSTRNPPAAKR
jgi:hypothetical protein